MKAIWLDVAGVSPSNLSGLNFFMPAWHTIPGLGGPVQPGDEGGREKGAAEMRLPKTPPHQGALCGCGAGGQESRAAPSPVFRARGGMGLGETESGVRRYT